MLVHVQTHEFVVVMQIKSVTLKDPEILLSLGSR